MQKLAEVSIRRPVFASMIILALVVVEVAVFGRVGRVAEQRDHRADGGGVVDGEHCIHPGPPLEQLLHRPEAVGLHEAGVYDQIVGRFQSRFRERLAISIRAPARVHDGRAGDMCDALPACADEMRGREAAHFDIVGQHAVAAHARMIVAIDHHQGRAQS